MTRYCALIDKVYYHIGFFGSIHLAVKRAEELAKEKGGKLHKVLTYDELDDFFKN